MKEEGKRFSLGPGDLVAQLVDLMCPRAGIMVQWSSYLARYMDIRFENGWPRTLARWLHDSSEGRGAAPQVSKQLLVHRLLAVEERRKNWKQQISPGKNVVMGGTRQDGEV